MQLLGNYQSNLAQWYTDELLSLINSAISKGDYAGGFTFSQDNIETLSAAGEAFSALTLPTAGTRAIDEDFNYPLGLLSARFAAISTEIVNFTAEIKILIDLLTKDTNLLDQLINAVKLQNWISYLPTVLGTSMISWGFGVGFGSVGFNLDKEDPANGVIYAYPARSVNYADLSSQVTSYGLAAGVTTTSFSPKDISWIYNSPSLIDLEYGDDWAELDFLAADILLPFNPPQLNVLLPNNVSVSPFVVTGTSIAKGIPIFVRTLFTPRTTSLVVKTANSTVPSATVVAVLPNDQVSVSTHVTTTANTNGSCSIYLQFVDVNGVAVVDTNSNVLQVLVGSLTTAGLISDLVSIPSQANIQGCKIVLVQNNVTVGAYALSDTATISTPIRLTNGYSIDPTTVSVFSDEEYYLINQDYVATGEGFVTSLAIPDSTIVSITFTEYYPSYQCSINQSIWSQVIMFDYLRPYPDSTTVYQPIPIGVDSNGVRNLLPIVDDSGLPTGLFITMNGFMLGEYLLQVYQDADASIPGQTTQLLIDFGQPRYMNVLSLSSYTNFPVKITNIDCQGFSSASAQTLFTGSMILSKPIDIRFPTTLISSVTITFRQENYTIKQHQILPDDYIRREAINNLQSVIPVAAQEPNILPQVVFANGYQYEFGIEGISGGMEVPNLPTVFISGPYLVSGRPDTLTLHADYVDDVDFYICHEAYNANDQLLESNPTGYKVLAGTTVAFPYLLADTTLSTTGGSINLIDHTNVYVKVVFRSYKASIKAFAIQVG